MEYDFLNDLSRSDLPTGLIGSSSVSVPDFSSGGMINTNGMLLPTDNLDLTLGELTAGNLTSSSGPSIMDSWSSPSTPMSEDWFSPEYATAGSPFSMELAPLEMDVAEDTSIFAPVKEAAATVDTFLRGIVGKTNIGKFYGSAILFGAQAILAHLNDSDKLKVQQSANENAITLQQDKFTQEDKVRAEERALEAEKRARQGTPGRQSVVTPNTQVTAAYKPPGYMTNKIYQDIDSSQKYGILGG